MSRPLRKNENRGQGFIFKVNISLSLSSFQQEWQKMTSAANPQMSHSFSYDLNNRLTGQYDMYGKYVTYQYDGLNRRTQMTAPDGRVFTYSYTTGNRLSQIVAAA
jgi:YD repeat-containing protein